MGFQLWYSRNSKVSRKGTTFHELQNIFIDNITTKLICEPLASCKIDDNSLEVKNMMELREFDTLGVVNQDGEQLGYIKLMDLNGEALSKYILPYELSNLISDSTPISDLIDLMVERDQLYVINANTIGGIVTRADINKPVVRIYLFGITSLLELHLNFWINNYLPDERWKKLLSDARITMAKNLYEQRKGNNSQLTLLECLQLCDKKTILENVKEFLSTFKYSKKSFNRVLERSEIIRNELAHSQNSIISNMPWGTFVETIKGMKVFLNSSEIEKTK